MAPVDLPGATLVQAKPNLTLAPPMPIGRNGYGLDPVGFRQAYAELYQVYTDVQTTIEQVETQLAEASGSKPSEYVHGLGAAWETAIYRVGTPNDKSLIRDLRLLKGNIEEHLSRMASAYGDYARAEESAARSLVNTANS